MLLVSSSRATADTIPFVAIEGSKGCAARPDFRLRVAELVGDAEHSATNVRVDFSDTARGVRVRLRVLVGARWRERTVLVAGCDEANDTAIVLAALTIAPDAAVTVSALPEASTSDATSSPPAQTPREDPVPAATEPDARPEANKPAADGVKKGVLARDTPSPRSPPPSPAKTRRAWGVEMLRHPWLVRLAGSLDPASLNAPSGLGAVEIGTIAQRAEIALGARYAPPRSLGISGPANISVSTAFATLRSSLRIPMGPTVLLPGVGLHAGMFRAVPDHVLRGRARRALTGELAIGLALEWAFTHHLALDVGAELAVALRRPELTLDDSRAYRTPPVTGRLSLGVRFWSVLPGILRRAP